MSANPKSVARLITFVLLTQWLLLNYVLLLFPGPLLAGFSFGDDFAYLYSAAGHVLSGHSPYLEKGFIPLPSALFVPMALHHLPYASAATAFKVVNGLAIVGAMLWLCRKLRLTRANTVLVMLVTLTYGPAYSAIVEGNLDSLMMALLVATCACNRILRAAALGLSIGTKFYSLLLLPVWAMQRRWREIVAAATALVIVLLPFHAYLGAAFLSVTHRTSTYRLLGNQSPAVLFIECFGKDRKWLWGACYLALWGGTLLLRLVRDARGGATEEQQRFQTLHYLPWMASAPALVFYYTSVILLPLMAMLVATNQQRPLRRTEWLMAAGFILTGLHPWVFNMVLPSPSPILQLPIFRTLAPIGLSLMLIGSTRPQNASHARSANASTS